MESSSPEVMEYKAQRPSMTATAMRTIARPRSGSPPFLACAPPPAGRLAAREADAPAAEPARVSSGTLSVEFSGFTLVTYATLVLRINYLGYFPARRAACLLAPRAGAAAVQPGGGGIGRPRGRREAGLGAGGSAPGRCPAARGWPLPCGRCCAAQFPRSPKWRRLGQTRGSCLNCKA